MKTLKKFHYFIFPFLVVVFSIITYKILGYKPTTKLILINVGLAYLSSPKYRTINTQSGEKTIVKWLFLKKAFTE